MSPYRHVDGIDPGIRIIALTGSADNNTLPEFASDYVDASRKAGKTASFRAVPDMDHNAILRNDAMWKTLLDDIYGA